MNELEKFLQEQESLDRYYCFDKCNIVDSELESNPDKAHLNTANNLKKGSGNLLTKKEALVASFLVSDYSVSKIAVALCRSRNTIKMHIKNMKKKCKCDNSNKIGRYFARVH